MSLKYFYTGIVKSIWLHVESMLKEFSKSQVVTYAIKVAISQKRCKIMTLLPQITDRK